MSGHNAEELREEFRGQQRRRKYQPIKCEPLYDERVLNVYWGEICLVQEEYHINELKKITTLYSTSKPPLYNKKLAVKLMRRNEQIKAILQKNMNDLNEYYGTLHQNMLRQMKDPAFNKGKIKINEPPSKSK